MAGTGEPVAGWLRRVILLHDHIIRIYGGSPGILDASLLQAAIERPWTGLADGTSFYPDVLDKAAVLLERINTYHAFVDGNKRTGTMLALGRNGDRRNGDMRLNPLSPGRVQRRSATKRVEPPRH